MSKIRTTSSYSSYSSFFNRSRPKTSSCSLPVYVHLLLKLLYIVCSAVQGMNWNTSLTFSHLTESLGVNRSKCCCPGLTSKKQHCLTSQCAIRFFLSRNTTSYMWHLASLLCSPVYHTDISWNFLFGSRWTDTFGTNTCDPLKSHKGVLNVSQVSNGIKVRGSEWPAQNQKMLPTLL